MLSNRQIIHELSLDRDFRLRRRKRGGLEAVVQDAARAAFWDTMRLDIAQGKLEKWIPALADTVRSKLLRLLDPKGSLHRAVADAIDIDLIAQQCRNGSYNHEELIAYVLDLLPKICSPARDQDVRALRAQDSSDDYISRLQKLLDVLEAMQLDHANFLLMLSAPQVIPEAIPYEQRLFAADLEAGRTSLTRTNAWLLAAKQQLPPAAGARAIHTHAFLNLLFGLEPLQPEHIPETFHLDHQRLADTRQTLRAVILGGAVVLAVKTLLRRDVRGSWKELKSCVAALLLLQTPSSSSSSSSSSSQSTPHGLADAVRQFVLETTATPPAMLDAVRDAVARICRRGTADPVVRVVCNRVRGFVHERLTASNSQDKVRLAATTGEVLTGWGVGEWMGELAGVVERAIVWIAVDRGVSAGFYNRLLGVDNGV